MHGRWVFGASEALRAITRWQSPRSRKGCWPGSVGEGVPCHDRQPIIARHTLGYQLTSAGIDRAGTEGAWLLPADPDASARSLRDALNTYSGPTVAVVIADSDGRADRRGATVVSIGAAGVAPLRVTEHGGKRQEETFTDLIAAAAGIILGQRGRTPALRSSCAQKRGRLSCMVLGWCSEATPRRRLLFMAPWPMSSPDYHACRVASSERSFLIPASATS
ncbi:coenzyme F420-0:L-glutamate ligase [Streptomyces rubradiris]|uniref:Coenzyme F420:L-glutamate ligase-like domain-containing protein n=1 Tax=Streptomyces rubradiris TaxID=285531 RepID=A0ABQ3RI90_STRRR|nr:coenzyme F420-0:L-glutamate ligase [Streptomyces rubradiris]GHH21528.1 hypothetical protein GCM10018792_56210 [Streptomyces rubradiris]GHI55581.1 hypothetical protein Srubr_54270 [Streptomyces rubradiris]